MSLDFDALQAHQGPKAVLAQSVQIDGLTNGHSDAVQGFSGIDSVYVEVEVDFIRARYGPRGLTVLLESSANGSAWSTEHTFTIGARGTSSFTLDSPPDYLRVSWVPANFSEWVITSATASPPTVNVPGGEQGPPGETSPGSAIVRGPYSFTYQTANLATGITVYTPTSGDVLLGAFFIQTTLWDGTVGADIGTFVGTDDGIVQAYNGSPVFLAGSEPGVGTGILAGPGGLVQDGNGFLVTATNPLKLVVTQEGTLGGTPIDSTMGAANLYIITASPVAFS